MTKKIIQGMGAAMAVLAGLVRGTGACLLLSDAVTAMHAWIGFILLAISLWLITVGISFVARPTVGLRRWLTAGVLAFWVDGLANGILLFGAPRPVPQLFNGVCAASALLCLWLARTPEQPKAHRR